jgi:GAF domain-containing protein/HAMP domain-containing protein
VIQFRSPLIWRLILWFLLLSLIPIGIVLVFVQRQVRSTVADQQIQGLSDQASLLSQLITTQPERTQTLIEEFGTEDQTAFLLDKNGIYLAHSIPSKIGSDASLDLSTNVLQQLLSEPLAKIDNSSEGQYIGSAKLTAENNIVVISANSVTKIKNIDALSRGIILQLAVSLLITSLAGGAAIIVVLNPIVQLSNFADQLAAGELEAEFDTTELEGEVSTLAQSLNNLAVGVRDAISTLEQRVQERTVELEERNIELENRGAELAAANQRNKKRASQFEAIAQVTGAVATIRTLEELLPKITHLISEQFKFYHVGIFLNDASNQYTTLCAANSEGGQRMLARKHQLKIGEQGIVGMVGFTGKPRLALDVGEDAMFFNNPDLPDTHSEMALPLTIGERVVGALDVQSKESGAFDEEDLQVLSILANQLSLAIENARLFEESSRSLAEAEALYRQYLRQAWGRMPKEQQLDGYHYSAMGAKPIEHLGKAEKDIHGDLSRRPGISVPIMLRGESIGTLAIQVPEVGQVNEDQMDLIKAVAERVAISAENARLFEETTRRAERERLVTDITAKIRSTNDPDVMIQTALNELKTALGATNVQLVPHTLQQSKKKPLPETPPNPPGKSKKAN